MFLEEYHQEEESPKFTADYLKHVCHSEDYKLGASLSTRVFASPSVPDVLISGSHATGASVYKAALLGCSNSIKKLVEQGANVNTPNIHGTTPVALVSGMGNLDALKTLLDLGADMEARDRDGNPPVCIAAFKGDLQVIDLLVSFGADVNSSGIRGWTPLMISAQCGCDTGVIVERLVDLGADINIRGGNGETALALAVTSLDIATALLLVCLGADISSYMMEMVAPTADIHDLFSMFCKSCNATNSPEMYALFSLTKLMLSVQSISDDIDESSEVVSHTDMWEEVIACTWQQRSMSRNIQRINRMSYDARRRFILMANSVYDDSLSADDDGEVQISLSLTPQQKAQRYVELVCFFCDELMLRDVLALRLTCRTNHEWQRFPVYATSSYHELERNLVESYVAYDAARFVSAKSIGVVIGIHAMLRG